MAYPRVLIVDEPEERLPLYRSVIAGLDAQLAVAHSGTGNLTAALQEDYAVILVNLTAPDGAGLAAVHLIRRTPHTQRTPVILLGADAVVAVPEGIDGPVDYLPVAVLPEVLRAKVRIFIELHTINAERTAQLQGANTRLQELSRLKDEFLATMSHELRTPLNAILGWTTLLRTGQLDAATAERALETVERNARAQKHLIEDLLDISRIVSGKVQLELSDFDPRQVVESALATMTPAATARRITLNPQLAPHTAPVRADFARLQQVVCNLLSNAIKFSPEGGQVELRLDRDLGAIRITVTDTGQGISAHFLPHVFDRFRQEDGSISRRHSGLGLGLAIVRHLVELHGGAVAADSPGEGHGATFTVTIPVRDSKVADPAPPVAVSSGEKRLAGIAVLVVDDDPGSRDVMAGMLQNQGARVMTVDSGERAWELLQTQAPDVLIADLAMPQMTGLELIQRLRQLDAGQGGRTPAIAVSAYASAPDRRQALQAGFHRHVGKPVEPEELVTVVLEARQLR